MLEKGIPWDVIHSLSVEDIAKLVGVMSALQEKQNRDQEDADRRMNNLTKGH